MKDFTIFCAGCGRQTSYQSAWSCMAKALVCGKECHDKVENDYCRALIESNAKKPA